MDRQKKLLAGEQVVAVVPEEVKQLEVEEEVK